MKTIDISKSGTGVKEQCGLLPGGFVARKELVYTKFFGGGHSISLRPFCITRDFPFLEEHINAKYAGLSFSNDSFDLVAASLLYTRHSDFARSFTCILDHEITIEVIDIVDARKTELYDCEKLEPGDFCIELFSALGEKSQYQEMVICLQTCLEYFFSVTEVKRIICAPYADEKETANLLLKNGFLFMSKIYGQYSLSNLFYCTRETFLASL